MAPSSFFSQKRPYRTSKTSGHPETFDPTDLCFDPPFFDWQWADKDAECTYYICREAPLLSLESFLHLFPNKQAFFWSPDLGVSRVATGSLKEISWRWQNQDVHAGDEKLREEARFIFVQSEAKAFFETLKVDAPKGSPRPIFFGGFSFALGSLTDPLWKEFADAQFVFPRWCYTRTKTKAWLSLTLRESEKKHVELLTTMLNFFSSLQDDHVRSIFSASSDGGARWVEQQSEARYCDLVQHIQAEIRAQKFKKMVAARRGCIETKVDTSLLEVLLKLKKEQQGCTRFGLQKKETSFVGVSPEKLIHKRGDLVLSEALAGTASKLSFSPEPASSATQKEKAELKPGAYLSTINPTFSAKDKHEQSLVVDEIHAFFEHFCSFVKVPAKPLIRHLNLLSHLSSRFWGKLKNEHHILELVSALHPTPAVGGSPRQSAQQWIAQHEEKKRGWYASPIGFFDDRGDGEFIVAIRSALLDMRHAYIYTGAGIVATSDPALEYRETALKQGVMARALGVQDE